MPSKLDISGEPMPEREDDEGSMKFGDRSEEGEDHPVSQRRLFETSNYLRSFNDLR